MPVDATHPLYQQYLPLWTICRDCHRGQQAIKSRGTAYLPATEGMHLEGMGVNQDGARRYNAYLKRAVFPEVMKDTVDILVGILNRKPASIELPEEMEPLRDHATVLGESLSDLLRKIHEQQLIAGRVGLHADVPQEETVSSDILPLLATYEAETVINWDDGAAGDPTRQKLNLVVVDESEPVRDGLEWRDVTKHRVLFLGSLDENEGSGVYKSLVVGEDDLFDEANAEDVLFRSRTLDEIPFVFIGPHDMDIHVDQPPLLGLANRSLSIYMGEADLRASLFATSQDTLVIIGNLKSEDIKVGPGAVIPMQEGGDARFIGVNSQGIQYQLASLRADYEIANSLSARLAQRGASVESGDALRIRVAAQTASLSSVAQAAAAGLQEALRMIARWLGANPDEVKVLPNQDFADDPMEASELLDLLTFKQRGGAISYRTINEIMVHRDITTRTLEEEIKEIEEEDGLIPDDLLDLASSSMLAQERGGFGQPFDDEEGEEETQRPQDLTEDDDGE